MKIIAVAQFKAQCLKFFEDIKTNRQSVVVTKRGEPIAEIIPLRSTNGKSAREELLGSVLFEHDIISPLDKEWDVLL